MPIPMHAESTMKRSVRRETAALWRELTARIRTPDEWRAVASRFEGIVAADPSNRMAESYASWARSRAAALEAIAARRRRERKVDSVRVSLTEADQEAIAAACGRFDTDRATLLGHVLREAIYALEDAGTGRPAVDQDDRWHFRFNVVRGTSRAVERTTEALEIEQLLERASSQADRMEADDLA